MANPTIELIAGSDTTIDRENTQVVRRGRVTDTLPVNTGGLDYFDYISSTLMAWVQNNVPTYGHPFGTLYWQRIQLHEQAYGLHYEFDITYGTHDKQTGTFQVNLNGIGGTQNVTIGTHVASYDANGPVAARQNNVIGAQIEGPPSGIDIPVPSLKVSVSYRHPQNFLTLPYCIAIAQATGRPNANPWNGFPQETLRFLGPQFSVTNTEASATYEFAFEPTLTNFTVGGVTVTEKKGQHILSPVIKDGDDGNGHFAKTVETIDIIKDPGGLTPIDYFATFGW